MLHRWHQHHPPGLTSATGADGGRSSSPINSASILAQCSGAADPRCASAAEARREIRAPDAENAGRG
jgi:hypothetical protein